MIYKPKTIAEWFIHRAAIEGDYLTQMKLQKLVYMAHGWNLGLFDSPLIHDTIEAWQWGPVIRSLYAAYAQYGGRPIDSGQDTECPKPDKRTAKLLERVWNIYGQYSAARLSDLTHRPGTPWSVTYQESAKLPIPNALIKAHYQQLARRK